MTRLIPKAISEGFKKGLTNINVEKLPFGKKDVYGQWDLEHLSLIGAKEITFPKKTVQTDKQTNCNYRVGSLL